MIRFLSLSAALLLLSACGPEYKTFYSFSPPPQSVEATQCLQNCEIQQQQCRLLEDTRFTACRSEARADKLQCEADGNAQYQACLAKNPDKPKNCSKPYCMENQCTNDRGSCEESYRTCYSSCGGTVTSRTECVSGCDQ